MARRRLEEPATRFRLLRAPPTFFGMDLEPRRDRSVRRHGCVVRTFRAPTPRRRRPNGIDVPEIGLRRIGKRPRRRTFAVAYPVAVRDDHLLPSVRHPAQDRHASRVRRGVHRQFNRVCVLLQNALQRVLRRDGRRAATARPTFRIHVPARTDGASVHRHAEVRLAESHQPRLRRCAFHRERSCERTAVHELHRTHQRRARPLFPKKMNARDVKVERADTLLRNETDLQMLSRPCRARAPHIALHEASDGEAFGVPAAANRHETDIRQASAVLLHTKARANRLDRHVLRDEIGELEDRLVERAFPLDDQRGGASLGMDAEHASRTLRRVGPVRER